MVVFLHPWPSTISHTHIHIHTLSFSLSLSLFLHIHQKQALVHSSAIFHFFSQSLLHAQKKNREKKLGVKTGKFKGTKEYTLSSIFEQDLPKRAFLPINIRLHLHSNFYSFSFPSNHVFLFLLRNYILAALSYSRILDFFLYQQLITCFALNLYHTSHKNHIPLFFWLLTRSCTRHRIFSHTIRLFAISKPNDMSIFMQQYQNNPTN